MPSGSWDSPVIVHRRGRLIRHTSIVITGTMNGTSDISTTLPVADMPLGVFAGTVQCRSDGGTNDEISRFIIKSQPVDLGEEPVDTIIYEATLTIASDPDYFPIQSVFEGLTAPTNANFMSDVVLVSNEWVLFMDHTTGTSTTETLTVYIGLLSHVLEV